MEIASEYQNTGCNDKVTGHWASTMRNPAMLFLSLRALGAPAVVVSLAIQGAFCGLKDTKMPLLYSALIASSFAKLDYKKVKEVTYYALKTGVFVGIALALILFASFGRLAELFSKDPTVIQIVGSGVLFVSARQPINALAFIFYGLHFGVSDFSYSASSMMVVGALSSLVLLYAPQVFGHPGVWAGLALFTSLRMTAGFLRSGWRAGPWWFWQQKEPKYKLHSRLC